MVLAIDARMKHGVGTVLRNIVPLVAREVGTLKLLGEPEVLEAWVTAMPSVEIIPFTARLYSFREQAQYPVRHVENCDLLHVPHFNIPFRRLKCPIVVTINDTAHLAGVLPMNAVQKAYAQWYYSLAVRRACHIITLSEFSRNEIVTRLDVPPDRISVVPCGVDRKLFRPVDRTIFERVARDRGVREPFLLVAGSVRPHKNVAGVLKAFSLLKRENRIPHQLVVTGQREGFRLNQSLPQLDPHAQRDVVFTGFINDDDLVALYSFTDVFVFASVYEGFGLPPLEAMACGAPVAVSRCASLPEVIGEAGIYFDPYSVEDIAKAVHSLLADTRKRDAMVEKSGAQLQKYRWEDAAKKYLEVYHRAARREAARVVD